MMKWLSYIYTKLALLFNIRIINIPMVIKGIGHQINEPIYYIKQKEMGLSHYKYILFFSLDMLYSKDKKPHTNYDLLKYLKPYFVTIVYECHPSRWERLKFKFLYPLLYVPRAKSKLNIFSQMNPRLTIDTNHVMSNLISSVGMFEMSSVNPTPLLRITQNDLDYGRKIFANLGIPTDAWFVTFHVRTSNFYAGIDYENEYNNRCADIDSYYLAFKYILDQGGYCISISGQKDLLTPKILSLGPKVINISEINCDKEKISPFLFSQCKFFLGCNSGPSIIPGHFGVPVVQVQTSPFWGIPLMPNDLFIFKKLKYKKENRLLSLKEMFDEPICHTNLDSQFTKLGLEVIDNTPEEVFEVVKEMNNRLDGTFLESFESTRRQAFFKSYFHYNLYSYRAVAKVGSKFLEANSHWFQNMRPTCPDRKVLAAD